MNQQKIAILVDSGCDVPQAVRQAYDMVWASDPSAKSGDPEGEYARTRCIIDGGSQGS